ncbi:MFS transporter [Paeniglutamicibacter sp. MACA_103]|uniref:MFS transporter n=1 Tax=Paeniglutamicibacter sp. MACA_103 TaxID=3377337 RepID=UPI0038955F90
MAKESTDAVGAIPDPVLRSIGFLAFFDRFATPPMLVALAMFTVLSLAQAVQLVAVYALFYAFGQPLWGLLSDRFGRLTVLRMALVGALLGSVASTLFITYVPLLVVRAFTGFMFGALYPTLLTLLGDTRTGTDRARGLSDLQIYSSLGATLATLGAGAVATFVDWRLVFGLPALGAGAILLALARVSAPSVVRGRFELRRAFTGAAVGLYVIALVEGMVLLGALTYIVPALQHSGVGIGVAGLLATGYAVGVILGARAMKILVHRLSRTRLICAGGSVLTLACGISMLWPVPAVVTTTATLIGVANAVMHSSMQGWATDVAPQARATTVSLFAASLFLGGSLGNFATAALAEAGSYAAIFGYGLLLSAALTMAASIGHGAWGRRHSGPDAHAG